MPAMSRFRPMCFYALGVVVTLMFTSAQMSAQTSGITLTGAVSETVVLSVSQILPPNTLTTDVVSIGNRVDVTFSSGNSKGGVIRLPLLVRSNSGFKISALLESKSASVTQVVVTSVRATGSLVSPQAVSAINIERPFEVIEKGLTDSIPFEGSMPMKVLSGPRISLGGTLESPANALEIVLLIRLKSESGPATSGRLTLIASPESRIP